MTPQDRSRARDRARDHEQLVSDLRKLPSSDLGKLAEPLLPAAMDGSAGQSTLEALRLIGEILSERKSGRAA